MYKGIMAILLLCSASFATTCYFSTDFGRTVCIEQTTPEQHLTKVKIGLQKVIDGNLKANLTKTEAKAILQEISTFNGQAPAIQQEPPVITADEAKPSVVSPNKAEITCAEAKIKDWNAYCVIMQSQGFLIDCQNANEGVKQEILGRLATGRQSYQYGCVN